LTASTALASITDKVSMHDADAVLVAAAAMTTADS
jgi:hypothetical protein